MKKLILFWAVVFALLMVVPVGAQHRIGLTGGLNLANVSTDPAPEGFDLTNRTGFGVGGVLDLRLAENVALHLEPMYLQKGTKFEVNGEELAKIKADYIEVPALVKIAFGTTQTKPYIMAGPSIGFLLSAKVDDEDIKEFVKSTDFGLGFGAGVSLPAGNNAFFIEGRYNLGLSNINDDPDDTETKIKTKGIQFMAGITFPLGAQ
jgi:opacity protein-like surface antigen